MSDGVPLVYVGMTGDMLHNGHINILNCASQLGTVVVGLLTDQAVASYKRVPVLDYNQRKSVIEQLRTVDRVVPQNTLDYLPNLLELRPQYVVHGSDWKVGVQSGTRQAVIDTISEWGGELVEPDYTEGISSTMMASSLQSNGVSPEFRISRMRRILAVTGQIRAIEVHNGLTGIIAEESSVVCEGETREFDAFWLSSLTHSASKGKPDNQIVDSTMMTSTINEIFDVTTKPMIVDLDNGGPIEHFGINVRRLERLGVSAVIIEDKIGKKRNSLFEDGIDQRQDSIEDFSKKIQLGKDALVGSDFMIIARIESLILNKGMDDALERASAFVASGADGIMIHSKSKNADEILAFIRTFRESDETTPVVVVPSTYSSTREDDLYAMGANVIIYANHLIRAAFPAMRRTAETLLREKRALEAEEQLMPISDIIRLVPVD